MPSLTRALDLGVAFGIGIAGGVLSGLLGIGGGSIVTPALTLLLGVPQHVAQSISLGALLPPVGIPSLRAYLHAGVRVVWPAAWMLIGGFVVASPFGGILAHEVPERELTFAFAALLVLTALRVWTSAAEDSTRGEKKTEPKISPRLWSALLIGALGGLISGVFGIGGGIVVVPLLRKLGRFDRLSAQALSLTMMIPPVGIPALVIYRQEQHGLRWDMIAVVAVAFAIGGYFGAKLAVKIDGKKATRAFALLLVVSAVLMVWRVR